MTDKKIMQALNCCTSKSISCQKCPLLSKSKCERELIQYSFELINRQQAEIEELNAEIDKQYEQAVADIKGNLADGGASCHWCIEQNKAEAIKEFVDRLGNYKEYRYNENCDFVPYVKLSDIEKVVYEMVGDEE